MKIIIKESQLPLLLENLQFEEVYKKTYPKIFNSVCMRYAKGDYDLASEYCQLGFIKVYKNLHKYSNLGSLEGWVRRVVTNTINDEFKRQKRELETVPDFELDLERLDLSQEPESFEEISYMGKYPESLIRAAVNSLPDGYKYVFYNYYFGDKSYKEIADDLGIKEVTSRTQLHKAKKLFKDYLEKHSS